MPANTERTIDTTTPRFMSNRTGRAAEVEFESVPDGTLEEVTPEEATPVTTPVATPVATLVLVLRIVLPNPLLDGVTVPTKVGLSKELTNIQWSKRKDTHVVPGAVSERVPVEEIGVTEEVEGVEVDVVIAAPMVKEGD